MSVLKKPQLMNDTRAVEITVIELVQITLLEQQPRRQESCFNDNCESEHVGFGTPQVSPLHEDYAKQYQKPE